MPSLRGTRCRITSFPLIRPGVFGMRCQLSLPEASVFIFPVRKGGVIHAGHSLGLRLGPHSCIWPPPPKKNKNPVGFSPPGATGSAGSGGWMRGEVSMLSGALIRIWEWPEAEIWENPARVSPCECTKHRQHQIPAPIPPQVKEREGAAAGGGSSLGWEPQTRRVLQQLDSLFRSIQGKPAPGISRRLFHIFALEIN